MNEFPYTEITGKMPSFFERIKITGIPTLVDARWLTSIGYKSRADKSILRVLRTIDFVDNNGKPTERWKSYRDRSSAAKVLGQAVKDGYADLFLTYPDANSLSSSELKSFFSSRLSHSEATLNKVVTTFKTLVSISDFSDSDEMSVSDNSTMSESPASLQDLTDKTVVENPPKPEGIYTININIQLTLPITTDQEVFDELFKSLKKNLFP